ncbi:MAG: CBS domain-containing protein [Nitrospirales bacterium]|nr:CBS domain-containing protein [Nitrospira sp.]MDR4500079.1 CBS domain-containing protein [Nitrospirales bacterium]
MTIDSTTQKTLRESRFGQITADKLMETAVRSETSEATAELIASMLMEGFGSVPIIDHDDRLLGIVSEFDLLNTIASGKTLAQVKAGEIMTSNPISVTTDTDVFTVIEVLQNNHLIRVPVVNSSGKLVGILARRDVLRGYLQANASW